MVVRGGLEARDFVSLGGVKLGSDPLMIELRLQHFWPIIARASGDKGGAKGKVPQGIQETHGAVRPD
ncbi:hypothetical protein O9K51_00622 [Purpureocillium lavendulum]|uniref:Uncharacterized protein n=1 Tax=Purpureocillium lavendulum TaxID=1247861 RepID=A0AB34G2K2_9HYPO|nr:hypothetical protein O9K51_00622 [Purpureocillium lavendulum]